MATQISMLITLLLATGATASAPDVTPMQQKATLESDTNQQCDTVNELSGAANSASGRFQGEEELNLLQERILVNSAHAALSRNGATLSASGTPPANFSMSTSLVDRSNASNGENQTISLEEKTENKLPVGVVGGWFQGSVIKWHPACRWPFAHLYPYYGSSGDVCYHHQLSKLHNWFCPDGCTGAQKDGVEQVPYCIQGGSRDACEVADCPGTMWNSGNSGDATTVVSELEYQGARLCRMSVVKHYIVPRGCKWGKPPGWSYATSVDEKDPSKLCRVGEGAETPVEPTGMWTLVGTKSGDLGGGDVTVEIEVGFVSSQSKATTKEESTRFLTKVEASASISVGIPGVASDAGSVGGSVSFERTNTMAETVKSASESSSTHTVNIKCPSWYGWMTWVYQWQVANSEAALKSEHFRCHYSLDGYERAPQCPPNACGMPTLNPYCLAAPEEGGGWIDTNLHLVDGSQRARDPSCRAHRPTKPGCWLYKNQGWSRVGGDNWNLAQRDPWYCEVKVKQSVNLVTTFIPHSELPDVPGCWSFAPGCHHGRYVEGIGTIGGWFKEVKKNCKLVKKGWLQSWECTTEYPYDSFWKCEVERKQHWESSCGSRRRTLTASKFIPYPKSSQYPYPTLDTDGR